MGFVFQDALPDRSDFWCVDCPHLCLPKLQNSVSKNCLFGCCKCPDINSSGNRLMTLVEIVRLQEQAGSKKVTPIYQQCDDEEEAVSSCTECAIFLCEFCEKAHKKYKATKEHKINSLDEMRKGTGAVPSMLPEKVEMCPTHPTKPLELYCKCEEVLICRDCIIKKHKNHDYDVISDVVDAEKRILKEALPGIQQLIVEVEDAVAKVETRREDVKSKEEKRLHNLDNAFNFLHASATLDERKKQLKEKIAKDSKEKDKGLQVQKEELCILLSQLNSCHSFIEDKVQRGVNQDVLAMKRSMLERRDKLKEVKNQTKLYPVVKIPLAVSLKDQGEIVKSISKFDE